MKRILKYSLLTLMSIALLLSSTLYSPKLTQQDYSTAQAKGAKKPTPKPSTEKPKAKTPPVHAKTRTHNGKKQVQATRNNSTKWLNIKNGKLAGKKHPKTKVKFNKDGFPIFKSYGSITLPSKYLKSSNSTQFKYSNLTLAKNKDALKKFNKDQRKQIKEGKTPEKYTWHHHQTRGYMQLVNTKIHKKTGHTGGKSIWGTK